MATRSARDPWQSIRRWWVTRNVSRRVVVGAAAGTLFATVAQLLGLIGLHIVAAAALAFAAGVIYPPNHQHRLRNTTGSLSLLVGAAAVGVLVVSLAGTEDPPPDHVTLGATAPTTPTPDVIARVDYAGDNAFGCQGILTNQKPADAAQPPADEADGNDVQEWRKKIDGVDGGQTHIRINLQGTSDTAVVLQDMKVRIVNRQAPSMKYEYDARDGCGEHIAPRVFAVDLDDTQPKAVSKDGADDNDNVIPAVSFPFSVSNSEPEVFLVDAQTVDCTCSWELVVHWTSSGRPGETVVRAPDGQPFVTHNVPDGTVEYQPDNQGGWFFMGHTKVERTLLATQGWRAIYPEYKPKSAWISADSTFKITKMTWPVWDADSATGVGTGVLNSCDPSCADGKLVEAPVHITLSKPDSHCDDTFFSRLDVEWTAKVPPEVVRKYTFISDPPSCT